MACISKFAKFIAQQKTAFMKILPTSLLLSILFVLVSCNSTPKVTCKYGEPIAMFSNDMKGVIDHDFSGKGQEATERVVLERGLEIHIFQSGCDAIRQEFRFILKNEEESEVNPIEKCGAIFTSLSGIDPSLAGLANWGNVILENSDTFRLGASTQVAEGFWIKIDRIKQGKDTLLIAILSETDN
jgi:hypothetical protein